MASIDRTAYPRFSHPLSDQELDARYGPTEEETVLTLDKSLGAGARLTFLVMLKTRQQLRLSRFWTKSQNRSSASCAARSA